MKNILTTGWIVVVALVSAQGLTAQEGYEIRPLQVNSELTNAPKRPIRKATQALTLPFFEDFSSLHSPYPNPELWQDNQVFVNANFPLFPPSIGVATFDAYDADGHLYAHASTYSFSADTLTSQPIRLDSNFSSPAAPMTVRDSVYFSYYYQPGGGFGSDRDGTSRGRAPKGDDVLILEFLNRDLQWVGIDTNRGQTLEDFCPLCPQDVEDYLKTYFKQKMILISDSAAFFHDQFQFRFRNYSSLDGSWQTSGGQWHIDYIFLNSGRRANNIFSSDVAFVEQSPRVLKTFQAIPFKQFRPTEDVVNQIPMVFCNLNDEDHDVLYKQHVFSQSALVWEMPTPSPSTVYPFYTNGFNSNNPDYSNWSFSYAFPTITTPTTYQIRHILTRSTPEDLIYQGNDTMVQTIHFHNYYAYDDGSAEAAFGLNTENGRFAYRFPLEVSDTLTAVQIQFNHTLSDMLYDSLRLMVWAAVNDSTPAAEPLFRGNSFLPIVGYEAYPLETPLVLPKGQFFIGFQQRTKTFLNIGFDQNNNAENRMFYYDYRETEWLPVLPYGSVMMRPVFGTPTPTSISARKVVDDNIEIYPNPSDGILYVNASETLVKAYEIYDLSGRRLQQNACRDAQFSIQLPQHSGVYILLLHTEKGLVSKKVVRR